MTWHACNQADRIRASSTRHMIKALDSKYSKWLFSEAKNTIELLSTSYSYSFTVSNLKNNVVAPAQSIRPTFHGCPQSVPLRPTSHRAPFCVWDFLSLLPISWGKMTLFRHLLRPKAGGYRRNSVLDGFVGGVVFWILFFVNPSEGQWPVDPGYFDVGHEILPSYIGII